MQLFKTTYFLVFSLFFPLSINPSNHYVDKNATSGGNNGTSWANAWQSFAAINLSSIEPGDIIYISGGRDSTVYYEKLFIGDVQGTAANPITIKNSYDAEHNGRVIIDGEHKTRRECIHIGEGGSNYSTDYITISGLELRGAYIGIWIHQQASSLVFDSLTITDWEFAGIFTQGLTNQHESIDGVIIQNSSLIGELLSGADCLQFNSSSNHIIRNNFIHQRNTSTVNNHVDGILGMWCAGFRVYNNVVIVDSNAQGHPYILRARADASDEDSVIVYNNFFYQGGIWHSEGTGAYNWSTAFLLRYNEEGYEDHLLLLPIILS